MGNSKIGISEKNELARTAVAPGSAAYPKGVCGPTGNLFWRSVSGFWDTKFFEKHFLKFNLL
jgi:hypothetical protein